MFPKSIGIISPYNFAFMDIETEMKPLIKDLCMCYIDMIWLALGFLGIKYLFHDLKASLPALNTPYT